MEMRPVSPAGDAPGHKAAPLTRAGPGSRAGGLAGRLALLWVRPPGAAPSWGSPACQGAGSLPSTSGPGAHIASLYPAPHTRVWTGLTQRLSLIPLLGVHVTNTLAVCTHGASPGSLSHLVSP